MGLQHMVRLQWILLVLIFDPVFRIGFTCEAFISPTKFTESEDSSKLVNVSVTDYEDDLRSSEGTYWSGLKINTSASDVELQNAWTKLKSFRSSRLSDLNVSTAQSLSSFLHQFADVQLGVTETKVRFLNAFGTPQPETLGLGLILI